MDNLEQYIKNNKGAFDEQPPEDIWGAIAQELPSNKQKSKHLFRFYKYASIGLILITAFLGYALISTDSEDAIEARLAVLAPDYPDVKTYYNVKMTAGLNQIKNASMKNELLVQLNKLDSLLEELKSDLLDAPSNKEKEIIERILNIYTEKVKIINKIVTADKTKSQNLNKQI